MCLTYIDRNPPDVACTFGDVHSITRAGWIYNCGEDLGRKSDRVTILVLGFLRFAFGFGKGVAAGPIRISVIRSFAALIV